MIQLKNEKDIFDLLMLEKRDIYIRLQAFLVNIFIFQELYYKRIFFYILCSKKAGSTQIFSVERAFTY